MTANKADEPPLIIDPADIELPPSTTVSVDLGEQWLEGTSMNEL